MRGVPDGDVENMDVFEEPPWMDSRRSPAGTPRIHGDPARGGRGRLSVEGVDLRAADGAAEGDEAVAADDQAADMAILPVLRILEAEAPLETQPPVVAATQAQAVRVHRLVEPLH